MNKIKKLTTLAAITSATLCSTVSAMDQKTPHNHQNYPASTEGDVRIITTYYCTACQENHSVSAEASDTVTAALSAEAPDASSAAVTGMAHEAVNNEMSDGTEKILYEIVTCTLL